MRACPTSLDGVLRLELTRHDDERGSFARTFCRDTFIGMGLAGAFVQTSISTTLEAGTLRGMHYQRAPHGEVKLVRCARGAIFDVVADLRPQSPSYGRWEAFELTPQGDALYIPDGCAHGFQTLTDDVEVSYAMDRAYVPEAATGFRYDDPTLAIAWPRPVTRISAKDLSLGPVNRS